MATTDSGARAVREDDVVWSRWEEVDRLFATALDHPESERPRVLRLACGHDRELYEAVLDLLALTEADDRRASTPGPDLLRALGSEDEAPRQRRIAPGDLVGRYRILGELGQGGMATVYEAERSDGVYRQVVALKVLRRGLDTDRIVDRFLAERQILSDFAHPNVARLLDGGATDDGRPFLVMEKVDGEPLTRWADDRRLGIRERLELFLQVTEAVKEAHRRLVVHRDLKPSNIIVDDSGRAKLLDFGIAKLLDPANGEPDLTLLGTYPLTRRYASPEQRRGDPVTTSSDIHQLGLILFELLTGLHPFPDASAGDPASRSGDPTAPSRAIHAADPELADRLAASRASTPRSLERDLRGDLDTIVRKALEADPQDRYRSVEHLAEDVRRHLDGRPIRARPASVILRARKWVGRNRWAPPVIAVLLLAAAGYMGTLALTAQRLERESNEARDHAERAVIVLPFELDDEGEGSTFARAVHSDIVNRLSRLSDLSVISPPSARRMAEMDASPPALAAELGVDWFVRGEVQRAGDRVRVYARLVHARADRQVWGDSYLAELTAEDLFDVQSEIARAIATVLEVRITGRESERLEAVPTRSTAAYELYLQGREVAGTGTADEDRVEAQMSLFRRAVDLDSTFAAAWARLSIAFYAHGLAADKNRAAWADSALKAAERALALDPELADGHVAAAFAGALSGEHGRMVARLRRAFELQPTNPLASHNLAVALVHRGRLAEAVRVRERAHRLAPTERLPILGLAGLNRTLGRDAVAEAWLAHARERGYSTLREEVFRDLFVRSRLDRARVLIDSLARSQERITRITITRLRAALALYEGDWREARRHYGSLYPGHPYASSPLFLGALWDPLGLAWSLRKLGDEEEAREIAAGVVRTTEGELQEGQPRPGVAGFLNHRLVVAHLVLGDTTAAVDRLEAAGSGNLHYLRKLETLPTLAPLRGHPGFRALLDRLRKRVEEERRRVEVEGGGEPPPRANRAVSGRPSRFVPVTERNE